MTVSSRKRLSSTRRLGDAVLFARESIQPDIIEPGTQYLGLEHLTGDGRVLGPVVVGRGDLASSKFKFTSDHVLFGKLRPYLRKVVRPEFSGVCSTDILPIQPKPELDRDYLYHWLRTPRVVSLSVSRCSGANLPRLSPTVMAEFEIPVPSLAEQRRVSAILNRAELVMRLAEDQVKDACVLGESLWRTFHARSSPSPIALNSLALAEPSTFGNGPFGSNLLTSEFVGVGVPVIYVQDIAKGVYRRVSKRFVTRRKAEELSSCAVVSGDVLIAKVGDPPGAAAVYPDGAPHAVMTQDVIRLRVDPVRANSFYLAAFLNSSIGQQRIRSITVEATRGRFSLGDLKRLEVPLPNVAVQNEFADALSKLLCVAAILEAQAEDARALFQSLQQRLFSDI